MNGNTVKLNDAYFKTLRTMQGPIMASELPKVRIDYKGLLAYAEKKGVPVIKLSDSEKNQFVTKWSV